MTEQKYTLILLLVGSFVVSATACTSLQILACRTDNGLTDSYGWPVLLEVPEDDVEDFCTNITAFSTCIDGFRDDCSFETMELYSSYEQMGLFICNDETRYSNYYDVISNNGHRNAWGNCFDDFELNGNETTTEGCSELEELVQCHMDEITGEPGDAQAYVREFGDASLADYYNHYNCVAGSSTVGVTSSLIIMSLLAYLWSTFH